MGEIQGAEEPERRKLSVLRENVINPGRGELTIVIHAGDILTLYDSINQLRLIFPHLSQTYENKLVEALKTVELTETKRRSYIASLLGCQPYSFISWPLLEEKFKELHQRVTEQILPKEVNKICSSATSLSKSLEDLYKPIKTFLNYFFVTPVNHSAWERDLESIIPVTERSLFSTWVKPFKKTEHEEGRSQSEDTQMIPSNLKEEHIDFYVTKIITAVQDYDAKAKELVQLVHSVRTSVGNIDSKVQDFQIARKPEDLEYLEKDVELFNHFLKELLKKPYSPQTGINTIGLNIARIRIKNVVDEIIEKLKNEASLLSGLGYFSTWENGELYYPSDLSVYIQTTRSLLNEAGFSVKYHVPLFGKNRTEVVRTAGPS